MSILKELTKAKEKIKIIIQTEQLHPDQDLEVLRLKEVNIDKPDEQQHKRFFEAQLQNKHTKYV